LVLATAIGTLFAAMFLLALNYRRLRRPRQASAVLAAFLIASCVELWVLSHSPGDLLSQVFSHTLFAVIGAYVALNTLRKKYPFVCNTKRYSNAPVWQALAVGVVANLAISGLLAKSEAIAATLR